MRGTKRKVGFVLIKQPFNLALIWSKLVLKKRTVAVGPWSLNQLKVINELISPWKVSLAKIFIHHALPFHLITLIIILLKSMILFLFYFLLILNRTVFSRYFLFYKTLPPGLCLMLSVLVHLCIFQSRVSCSIKNHFSCLHVGLAFLC